MKLIHLSDLHLGKRLNDFSLLDDQKHILEQILGIVESQRPDVLIMAGDIYDKAAPSAEAVALFDDFLSRLSAYVPDIFVISGNHDSPERIAFGSRLLDKSGVHLSPVYDGTLRPITLCDEHGEVDFFMLPFIKPANVRRFFPDEVIESYTDAVRIALSDAVDKGGRRVLITHQFVTGASRCDSEEVSVGGSDNVDAAVFDSFDYVALGHLHGAQSVQRSTLRYCGTPLKYSFSEAGHEKSLTVVELGAKGDIDISAIPLTPLHDLREIRGSYDTLTLRSTYEHTAADDYLRITLTDEDDIPDAAAKLRVIYPNLMRLDYDNRRTRASGTLSVSERPNEKTPLELFSELYEKQNGAPMDDEQEKLVTSLITEIWEAKA